MTQWNYGLATLGAVATANNSEASHPASLLIDGSDVTYWRGTGNGVGADLKVDLQTPQYIEEISVYQSNPGGYFTSVTTYYSYNGSNYFAISTATTGVGLTTIPTGGLTARYWRIVTGSLSGSYGSLATFGVWGPIVAPPPLENPTQQNVNDWLDSIDDNIRPIIDDWLTAHGY